MSIPILSTPSQLVSLSMRSHKNTSRITMKLPEALLTTEHIPNIHSFLLHNLPSIFKSTCYNPENLRFSDEVKKTEIAHLFEHMVLEYLVLTNTHVRNRFYEGVTSWDWRKEEFGIFHIRLNVGKKDTFLLAVALDKSCKLLSRLLEQQELQN